MLRIAALNESDSGEEEIEEQDGKATTREAEEAEAFAIYNRALGQQRSGDGDGAEKLLSSLLLHPFLQQASRLVTLEKEDSHHTGLPLLYLVHKNLAAMAIVRGDLVEGMKSYLEAVKIDASEVTVWYKMGIIAKKLHNYPLAKLAFEQGLQCNENHWPCLDSVITVLYALNDFWMCLDYIGRALERDSHYTKGLVFHRQILQEQPSLAMDTKDMFAYCDPIIHTIRVEESEAKKFLQEATEIREIRRELAKKPPPPPLKLPKPITELTWKCVGECLVELFDTYVASEPPKSLVQSLDLSEFREMVDCRSLKPDTKSDPAALESHPPYGNTTVDLTSDKTPAVMDTESMNAKPEAHFFISDNESAQSQSKLEAESKNSEKGDGVDDGVNSSKGEEPMEIDGDKVPVTVASSLSPLTAIQGQSGLTSNEGCDKPEGGVSVKSDVDVERKEEGSDAKVELKSEDAESITAKSGLSTTTTTVTRASTVATDSKKVTVSSLTTPSLETLVSSRGVASMTASVSSVAVASTSSTTPTTQASGTAVSNKSTITTEASDVRPCANEALEILTGISAEVEKSQPLSTLDTVTAPIATSANVGGLLSVSTVDSHPSVPTADGGPLVSSADGTAVSTGNGQSVLSVPVINVKSREGEEEASATGSQPVSVDPRAVVDCQDTKNTTSSRSQTGSTHQGDHTYTSSSPAKTNLPLADVPSIAVTVSCSPVTTAVTIGGSSAVTSSVPSNSATSVTSVTTDAVSAGAVLSEVVDIVAVTSVASVQQASITVPIVSSGDTNNGDTTEGTNASSLSDPHMHAATSTVNTTTILVSPAKATPLLSALVASVPLQTLPSPLPPIQIPLPASFNVNPLAHAITTSVNSTGSSMHTGVTPQVGGSYSAGAALPSSHSHTSPSKPSTSTTTPPRTHSPSLPKFQFSTMTARQVQVLLQDPLPSNPLLSTPAPSAYSPNMAERLRQMTSLSQPAASPVSTTASAQLQSLARLANLTNSLPAADQPAVTSAEPLAEAGANTPVSPSKRKTPQTTPVTTEVAAQGSKGSRRASKRKRAPVEDTSFLEDLGVKRRSARVRKTQKEEENVDFQKLLKNILPSTLIGPIPDAEDTQTQDTCNSTLQILVDTMLPAGVSNEQPLSETETEDVRRYLAECLNGQGVIGLMYKYLVHLSTFDNRPWPAGVPHLYCMVYERLHPHLMFPSLLCVDFPDVCYAEMAKMALVWCELTLDTYLASKADCMVSPAMTHRQEEEDGSASSPFTSDSAMFDQYFVTGMVETGHVDVLGDQASNFTIRVYWNKARLAMAEGAMETAIENLETVVYCLEQREEPKVLYLVNCTQDKLISLEEVKRQQESLQRCQSLEEIQRLFEAGQYRQVVDYLTPTFTQSQVVRSRMKSALPDPERHTQLEILMDALFRLQDLGQCLVWGEVALDEALHHYLRSLTVTNRENWALTLIRLFHGLQRVLDIKPQALDSLTPRTSVRIAQNLMRIIEINHDVPESVTEMPISSVLPWTLLYRVIKHEEEKLNALKLLDPERQGEIAGAISSSLMLLSIGHEYLGRHAWCTKDRGFFLLFYMEVLSIELVCAHESIKEDLETAFEQCVFCLYSHPNKKGKARHLFDHNVTPIDLTWEQCELVFEYFRPKTVPDFDSYKTSTVGAELENLLRRIYDVIPESLGPGKRVDQIQEYIDGTTNVAPNFSTDNPVLQELYYLLADYYFKNKEPPKAIKFYTYDICFNSWRLDSWAGLALAKNYQIEQKLNSMELKIDNPIHRKSIAALRCFSRAVEIDETVRKLWIEYGALAYQLHSHASRQLRMQLWFPLTPELQEIAMETRVEMLSTARNCYWKASECEAEGSEEEWLHHYMMGKVMEKKRAHPRTYLEHYKQAAIYLHEEEAKYPRKINYQHSPPHLALEALEMYYRLHVAVMKYMLRISKPETRDDMTLFDRYVTEATESPFARRQEKRVELRESLSSADDVESQSSATSIPPYSTAHQKPVYHMAPQDHTYSKQKSSGGETSDASYSVRGETLTETDGSQSGEEVDTLTASEIQSQESAEDEDHASTVGRGGKGREATKHNTAGVGRGGRVVRDKDEMGMEMVELHTETDSQVTGDFVDTKPLLYDKQVSGGFEPIVDMRMSSAHSASLPLTKKDSTGYEPIHVETLSQKTEQTKDTTSSQTSALSTVTAVTGGKSADCKSDPQAATTGESASGTVTDNTVEQGGQPTPMEVDAKGKATGSKDEELTVASITPTLAPSGTDARNPDNHIKSPSDVAKSPQKVSEQRIASSPPKAHNQNLSVITVSSQESGEMSQEEDFSDSISIHTSPSIISLSDENSDAAQPHTTPHKRPLQLENPPSKRPRVELFREEKNTAVEKNTTEEKNTAEEKNVDTKREENILEIKVEQTDAAGKVAGPVESEGVSPPLDVDASEGGTKDKIKATATTEPAAVSDVKSAGFVEGGESKSFDLPQQNLLVSSGTNVSRTSSAAVKMETSPSNDQPYYSLGSKNTSKSEEGEIVTEDASTKNSESAAKGAKSGEAEEKSALVAEDDRVKPDMGQVSGDNRQTAVMDVEMLDVADERKSSTCAQGAKRDSEIAGVSENTGVSEDNGSASKEKENTTEKEHVPKEQETLVQSASEEEEKASASGQAQAQAPLDSSAKTDTDKDRGKTADRNKKDTASDPNKIAQTVVSEPKEKTTFQPSNSSATTSDSRMIATFTADTKTTADNTKTTAATPSGGADSDKSAVPLNESEFREWKIRLLDKCVAGLHICLSRFPTHYKSLHRLAYLYYTCESHKNLEFARDVLLGNPDWQNMSHMAANGLFADRRANNFFQGTWKIPIEEIDRSGSFASHINRSMQLLLDVLRDLGDVRMLLSLHTQLRKKPDQGRKYLRDAERQILARMAHAYVLDAVAKQLERPESEVDKVEVLLNAYRAYNAHRSGIDAHRATMLLISAYRWLGLGQHGFGSLVEQAVQYCTALIASQAQASTPKSDRSRTLSTSSYQASTPTETTTTGVGTTPPSPFPPMSAGPPASTPLTTHLPASGPRLPSSGLPPVGGNLPTSSGGRLPTSGSVAGYTPQSPSAGMFHPSGPWTGGSRGSMSSPGVRQPSTTLTSSPQQRGPIPSHPQMSSVAGVHGTARPAHTGSSPSHSASVHAHSSHSLPVHLSHASLPAHSTPSKLASVPAHLSLSQSSLHARTELSGNARAPQTSLPAHTSAPSMHVHSSQSKPPSDIGGYLDALKSKAAPSGAALDLSAPKKHPISTSSPKIQPISASSPKLQPISMSSPKQQPISASSPKQQPISASSPKLQPISTSSPKQQLISASSPKLQPISTSSPKLQPISMSSPKQQLISASSPKLQPISTSSPKLQPISTSSPKLQPISVSSPKKQPISGAAGLMSGSPVIDLTSPEKSQDPIPSVSRPPHSLPTVSTPGRSHPNSPAGSTASHVTPTVQRGHHPSSPFSSPRYPSSISTATTPTPRRPTTDDVTDINLTSDPGHDLALTSPDKLTSDILHHFQGDL